MSKILTVAKWSAEDTLLDSTGERGPRTEEERTYVLGALEQLTNTIPHMDKTQQEQDLNDDTMRELRGVLGSLIGV